MVREVLKSGKPGANGTDGKDALGTWENVKKALSSATALKESIITIDSMGAPSIYGGSIYGAQIYAGLSDASNFAKISSDGFELYQYGVKSPKFNVNVNQTGTLVTLTMGAGSTSPLYNTFEIHKGKLFSRMIYTDNSGTISGFQFNAGGDIQVYGNLSGVTAVFG